MLDWMIGKYVFSSFNDLYERKKNRILSYIIWTVDGDGYVIYYFFLEDPYKIRKIQKIHEQHFLQTLSSTTQSAPSK